MFDDPKQRLYELEQALKAAEQEEQEEALWLRETAELLEDEDPEPAEDMEYFLPQEEPEAVFAEKPRRKGALPYVILALLELIAIGLVMGRWLQWSV